MEKKDVPFKRLEGFFRMLPWIPGYLLFAPSIIFIFMMILGLSGKFDDVVFWYALISVFSGFVILFVSRYTFGRRIEKRMKPRIDRLRKLSMK